MYEMMFGSNNYVRTIKVKYLVVDALSLYNIILWWPTLNLLGAVFSILHLSLNYPLFNGLVGVVQEDQKVAHEC